MSSVQLQQKCDYLRLRQGITKLLDPKYGDGRIQRVRAVMNSLPKRGRAFIGKIEEINELITLAELDFALATRIVDLTVIARQKLIDEAEIETPQVVKKRKAANENVKRYRRRLDLVRKAHEVKLGRKLSTAEAKDILDQKKAEWNERSAKYHIKHPELTRQQATASFATLIDKEAEKMLADALKEKTQEQESAERRAELRKPSDHVLRNRK